MKVIALYGHAGCGKTPTLKALYNLVASEAGANTLVSEQDGNDNRYAVAYHGKVVCICTGGDDADIIQANFDFAIANNADVLVTASRTKGETCEEIFAQERKHQLPTIEWLKKSDETNLSDTLKEVCNLGYAAFLLTQLNK